MMLKEMHKLLVGNSFSRKYQRRLTRWLKNSMGVPDAYGDLFNIIEKNKIEAVLDLGSFEGKTINRFLDEIDLDVYSFEPTPYMFEKLQKTFKNNRQVHLNNLALSDKTGKQNFYCNQNMQTNSLLENDTGNIDVFKEDTIRKEEIEVDTISLDDWLKKYPMIVNIVVKCDIQGAEGMLLNGGRKSFSERVIAFYSEAMISPMYKNQIHFFDLHNRLTKEFGFLLHNIYPCAHDDNGRVLQTDALWIKPCAL